MSISFLRASDQLHRADTRPELIQGGGDTMKPIRDQFNVVRLSCVSVAVLSDELMSQYLDVTPLEQRCEVLIQAHTDFAQRWRLHISENMVYLLVFREFCVVDCRG